ncbi:hypothetical protein [Nakamurella sp.]|uniref:hypothetical protein n=1 Tax=Nakamurella sp. TaxID=1869182 RepID=UPI003B3AAD79
MEAEVTEAMNTLAAFGQGAEGQEVLSQAVEKARARYDSILADATISEDYRKQLLAKAWQQHGDEVTAKLTSMAKVAAASDVNDASSVFGVKGLPGDVAQLAMSRRDAADRVKDILRGDQLMDLLNQATRSGDEVLARAVADQATQIGDAGVVNKFAADRPHLADKVERLWNVHNRRHDFMQALTTGALISGMKPRGFERSYESEITRRANGE